MSVLNVEIKKYKRKITFVENAGISSKRYVIVG